MRIQRSMRMLEDTIAGISTPPGIGGIGIVRMSGAEAFSIIRRIFKSFKNKDMMKASSHTIHYGYIYDDKKEAMIDEVLIMVMKAPHTYTKEDVIEINCHGGVVSIQKIMELVVREGARIAEPGEFTKRAFLNGRIDLSQAEAVIDIITAKTDMSLQSAVYQLEGSLSHKIKAYRHEILSMIAHIEATIDYPEHDIEELTYQTMEKQTQELLQKICGLIDTADSGKILREGLQTVIIGKPNVGKSSLMNALLKEQRAIVTDIPGTTRDILEEYINLRGVPLKIIDTAGIRDTEDVVEKIGVGKSKEFLEKADFILMLVDGSIPLSEEDVQIFDLIKEKKAIVIINKTDLPIGIDELQIKQFADEKQILKVSLKDSKGLDQLEKVLKDMFFSGEVNFERDVLVTNIRHKQLLEKAENSLRAVLETIQMQMPEDCISIDLQQAYEYLGEITGDSVGESIIDQIFTQFCLGK